MEEVKTRLEEMLETGKSPARFSHRKRKVLVLWGIAAGVAALLVAGVMRMKPSQVPLKAAQFEQLRVTADAGLSSYPAVSPDGQLIAYASDRAGKGNLDLWVQHWGANDARQLTLDSADKCSPSFNHNGTEIIYRSEQDGGGLYQISALGGDPVLLAPGGRNGHFSADGRWLVYWKGDVGRSLFRGSARTYLMPAHGGQPEEFPPGFDMTAYPVWSADGTSILFLGRKTGEDKGDWWIATLADKSVRRTGILEKLRLAKATSNRTYYPVPGVWLNDGAVLFAATYLDADNIWSLRVDSGGTVLEEPHRWSSGTETEVFPDAAVNAKGSIHAVYAALTTATSIWRIPLTPGGERGGDPELLTAMYRAGSPSLSLDRSSRSF
jgi:hypothetical protein